MSAWWFSAAYAIGWLVTYVFAVATGPHFTDNLDGSAVVSI